MSDPNRRPYAEDSARSQIAESAGGWSASGSFLGSILAGTLLGYLADLWLDTRPWFIVVGIIAGSYAGFMTMWRLAKGMDDVDRKRP
ncbi:MAG: AtpZ/AtpI family protein [Actinobacteria bacterium]|nr:AtpZ/AtpI family protein [Acidimicrobiia bacterium]MCA1736099.1 AtpZ/AtpI family protein [Actinomycetota bacterium]MDQ3500812.1 AtpZ/AtpI family protein [Actinomycetota bacterium]